MGIVHVSMGDQVHVTRNGVTTRYVVNIDNIAPIPRCYACDVNDVDDDGMACAKCVMRAIGGIQMRLALEHLMEGDERIAAVVDRDNAESVAASRAHMQYVSIEDVARDEIGDVDAYAMIDAWREALVNALRAMGARE